MLIEARSSTSVNPSPQHVGHQKTVPLSPTEYLWAFACRNFLHPLFRSLDFLLTILHPSLLLLCRVCTALSLFLGVFSFFLVTVNIVHGVTKLTEPIT